MTSDITSEAACSSEWKSRRASGRNQPHVASVFQTMNTDLYEPKNSWLSFNSSIVVEIPTPITSFSFKPAFSCKFQIYVQFVISTRFIVLSNKYSNCFAIVLLMVAHRTAPWSYWGLSVFAGTLQLPFRSWDILNNCFKTPSEASEECAPLI